MPGHMGAARHTELGLRVVRVDPERNLFFVRGAIPGLEERHRDGGQTGRTEPP